MLFIAFAALIADARSTSGPAIIHASIYKNGYAFVTREIPIAKSGDVLLDTYGGSTYGTLWFASTKGVQILQVTDTHVFRTRSVSASSLDDLLDMNIGHQVTLTLKDASKPTGKLKSIHGDLLILSEAHGERALFKKNITDLASNTPFESSRSSPSNEHLLRLKVKATSPGRIYSISLESGLSWDANYLAELDGKELALTARATLDNKLGDLSGVDVRLIAATPSIQFLGRTRIQSNSLLPKSASGLVGDSIDFISFDPSDNSIVVPHPNGGTTQAELMQPSGLHGVRSEDAFFYRQPKISLKLGEVGDYIQFRTVIPYTDIFTLDVSGRTAPSGIITPDQHQTVIHKILFKNSGDQPLTAASVTTLFGGELLGQSSIGYTPVGGECEFPISSALDVSGEALEEEVERKSRALEKSGQFYDLVTIRGTIAINNHGGKAVRMRIRKPITGEAVEVSDTGVILKDAPTLQALNLTTLIAWNLDIKDGQKLLLNYRYKAYVRQ